MLLCTKYKNKEGEIIYKDMPTSGTKRYSKKVSAQHYFLDVLTLCQTEKISLVIPLSD